jgi:hypothetical protein
MTGRPCDIPSPNHDGTARLYPCGWRCTSHAPQARTTAPAEPVTTPPVRLAARRTPAAHVLQVAAALRIDCGEGFAIKDAPPGEFSWKTHPRARYECVTCGRASETVTGAIAVRNFLDHIRATHKATCTGATTEGAHAA